MATVTFYVHNMRQNGDVTYETDWCKNAEGKVVVDSDTLSEWVWQLGWTAEGRKTDTPLIGPLNAETVCGWLKNAQSNPTLAAARWELELSNTGTVFLGDNTVDDWLEAIENLSVEILVDPEEEDKV